MAIVKLAKDVADKIAAGEVVERPLSAVKELLENALDAGADSVIIEIKNGGKSYIRITDNGCGIEKDDLDLAFERHATSKIRTAEDLDSIGTLGFRGEALSSIAAVSRVEMITKTRASQTGFRVVTEGGELLEKSETGAPDGTTIIVSDLFYNTPARLKFLKPDGTESALIIDFVSRMALAYPKVKIRLISNGSVLFSTPGKGDLYANILTVYGRNLAEHLIYVKEERDGMALEAYVSAPELSKTTRRSQIFFVNGRSINSKLLEHALTDGYREKLAEGRYPAAFLFLSVDPSRLDVNIHPNKREVRFDQEGNVRAFVADAVRKALFTRYAVPEIRNLEKGEGGKVTVQSTSAAERDTFARTLADVKKSAINQKGKNQFAGISTIEKGTQGSLNVKELLLSKQAEERKPAVVPPAAKKPEPVAIAAAPQISKPQEAPTPAPAPAPAPEPPVVFEETPAYGKKETAAPKPRAFAPEALHVTGSIFATYITASDDEFFYLIDQHAAHERVFYETLLAGQNKEQGAAQMLLTPFVVEVSPAVKSREDDWVPYLATLNYTLEEFGPKSYAVKEIPAFMDMGEARSFIDMFLETLEEERDITDPKKLERIITASCKSAIKANDQLDLSEMKQLLQDLGKCENPFSCPHGRPVFLKLSREEIEKLFKRR